METQVSGSTQIDILEMKQSLGCPRFIYMFFDDHNNKQYCKGEIKSFAANELRKLAEFYGQNDFSLHIERPLDIHEYRLRFSTEHNLRAEQQTHKLKEDGFGVKAFDIRGNLVPYHQVYGMLDNCINYSESIRNLNAATLMYPVTVALGIIPGTDPKTRLMERERQSAYSDLPVPCREKVEQHRMAIREHVGYFIDQYGKQMNFPLLPTFPNKFKTQVNERHYNINFPFVKPEKYKGRPFEHHNLIVDSTMEWFLCMKVLGCQSRCAAIMGGTLHCVLVKNHLNNHYGFTIVKEEPTLRNSENIIDLEDYINRENCASKPECSDVDREWIPLKN